MQSWGLTGPPSGTGRRGRQGEGCEPFAYVSRRGTRGELFAGGDGALVAHWEFQQQSPSASRWAPSPPLRTPRRTTQLAGSLEPATTSLAAGHPRGEILACALSGLRQLISREGGEDRARRPAPRRVHRVAVEPRRHRLATCGRTGRSSCLRLGYSGLLWRGQQAVYCVAFSPTAAWALCSGKHVVVKRIGGTTPEDAVHRGGGGRGGRRAATRREDSGEQRSIRWRAHDGVCPSTGPWRTARSSAGRTGGIRSGTPTVGCCSRAPW